MKQQDSHIYKSMSYDVAFMCGYFKTNAVRLDSGDLKYDTLVNAGNITEDTVIGYYPGAFGDFHKGHQLVAHRAYEYLSMMYPDKDIRIIVAPAHADYLSQKYGHGNNLCDNVARLKRIMNAADPLFAVDTAPMLCYTADMNFTDLCLHMLEREGLSWDAMKVKPYFIFGKDRVSYAYALNEFGHNAISIHTGDLNKLSTSKDSLFNKWEPRKKSCILRCHNLDEAALFRVFFQHHYREGIITPTLIGDEIEWVKENVAQGYAHTICKDYAKIPGVVYTPVSRFFKNPLIEPNELFYVKVDDTLFPMEPKDGIVLDSDIYSGFTARVLKEIYGYTVKPFIEANTDLVDIVDIDDFRKPNYCYPHVDVAGRCSMMTWQELDYKRYDEFRSILMRMKP